MSEGKRYATFRDLRTVKEKSSPKSTTSISSTPSSTSISSIPSSTSTPSPSKEEPLPLSAAPQRDFQRVPNSVTRQALPEGIFRGKSRQVWDYLWSVSRGAVTPMRRVRKSRKEIKAGAGLGSMVTVDAAIEHLQAVGLITVSPAVGSLIGNEYEIFTPDEASTSTSSITSISSTTSLTQKVVDLDILDSSISSITQVVENKGIYEPPKTSFKTIDEKIDDDEAFAKLVSTLKTVTKEVTGKDTTFAESERWNELASILATELKIAATRTTVSSVPAFLTEHLRRRLWKVDKKQSREAGASGAEEGITGSGKNAQQCPDCGGTGFYYPNGYEGGVARCKHERAPSMGDDKSS